jgi:outer membrane protein OmpA-like peptidoglycan-associated protein
MKLNFTLFLLFGFISTFGQEKLQLFFDFNKDVVNKKSIVAFDNWIKQSNQVTILKIEGYCDSIDTSKYNQLLASRRINAVLALLQNNAVKLDDKLVIGAIGENFDQAKIQSENRKVIVYYQSFEAKMENSNSSTAGQEATKPQEKKPTAKFEDSSILNQLENAKVGDLVQIQNLNFYFNSEKIVTESEPVLSSLLEALKRNAQLKINIYGHICCNSDPNDVKLSYRRSKFVFDYLIRNGIATSRLGHRGFGSSKPLYALPEKNEAERVANRRVEILVIQK